MVRGLTLRGGDSQPSSGASHFMPGTGTVIPPVRTGRSKYPVRIFSSKIRSDSPTAPGYPYSARDLQRVVENFNIYQRGKVPGFTQPKASYIPAADSGLGHEEDQAIAKLIAGRTDLPSFGYPASLWFDKGDLWAILDGVPEGIASAANGGQFSEVSAEIYPNFMGPDGRRYGPLLKRISLLGVAPPAQKGLNPGGLPPFVYSEPSRAGRIGQNVSLTFSELSTMSREEALAILAAAGIEATTLEGASDTLLIAFATAVKAAAPVNPAIPPPVASFSELQAQLTRNMAGLLTPVLSGMAAMRKDFGAVIAEANERELTSFAETSKAKLFPYESDPKSDKYIVSRLMGMSAESRKREMDSISNRPDVTKFSEAMGEGSGRRIVKDQAQGGHMTGERRQDLLSATPAGRAILDRERARDRAARN